MVLDECCETLLGAVDSADPANQWLVSLIGARGYPLGEHRRVGGIDPRLYGEQLHVPWLIRFPDNAGRLGRSGQLTSHADLAPSLVDSVHGTSVRALTTTARPPWRDALLATSAAGHRALRTAEWCLRQEPDPQSEQITTELFVRPDDRWEANDVAKLCSEVVETLANRLNAALPTPSG
jgi:arylsulfatase A-like enzyme